MEETNFEELDEETRDTGRDQTIDHFWRRLGELHTLNPLGRDTLSRRDAPLTARHVDLA